MKKFQCNVPLVSVIAVSIAIAIFWLVSDRQEGGSKHTHTHTNLVTTHESIDFYNLEIPFFSHNTSSPIDVKYELQKSSPKGILFFAHGCSHSAGDLWEKCAKCPDCLGLPEEITIRKKALIRGYVMVAVSSLDRKTKCWSEADHERVAHSLAHLLAIHTDLKGLPIYAMGASSGGMFVLTLASQTFPKFTAVCSQLMALHPAEEAMESQIKSSILHSYPPTLFVHMDKRDPITAEAVNISMSILAKHKISTKEIKVDPSPLTPDFLFRAIGPEVSKDQSRAIYEALLRGKIIDDKGFLLKDPRESSWREALASLPFKDKLRLVPDQSPIAEELNVLWAAHEIVAETTDDMLTWFEAQTP